MGTLFVVATPIGNLDDMSPRAIQTLRDVPVIAAEDTRHTARLLRRFDIETPMVSYHQHNEAQRIDTFLDALGKGDVALVTDAGTPAVSDPGTILVRAAHESGHTVIPVPGASSLVAAVSSSGIVEGPFLFLGFLPRSGEERRRSLSRAVAAGVPVVLFESPNRLAETLRDIGVWFGDVRAVVARELTKVHEEVRYGTVPDLEERFGSADVRGEVVIVVERARAADDESIGDAGELAARLIADGMKPSRAARELARITGMSSEEAYDLVVSVRRES